MMLVQSATHEGNLAAEQAVLGGEHSYRHEIVPHGGFTDPEYASVGLTERGAHARATIAPWQRSLTRSWIVPSSRVYRGPLQARRGSPLAPHPGGGHIVGEQAVEVVQIVATAMRAEMSVELLTDVEYAYPTLFTVVGIAARRYFARWVGGRLAALGHTRANARGGVGHQDG